jgi:hypothetical protein
MNQSSILLAERLKACVQAGGGVWVGIQESFKDVDESLVLFNSPFTKSTLALPVSEVSVEAVMDKIQGSDKSFKKTPAVIPDYMPMFIRKLRELIDEFEQLTKENK